MSVKRAVEYNFRERLRESLPVLEINIYESTRLEERILPCIILDATNSSLAVDHPDNMNNFDVDLEVVVITNFDEVLVNQHKDIVSKCLLKMLEKNARTKSRVQFLHLYSTTPVNMVEEVADRKMATSMTYRITCNYSPLPVVHT